MALCKSYTSGWSLSPAGGPQESSSCFGCPSVCNEDWRWLNSLPLYPQALDQPARQAGPANPLSYFFFFFLTHFKNKPLYVWLSLEQRMAQWHHHVSAYRLIVIMMIIIICRPYYSISSRVRFRHMVQLPDSTFPRSIFKWTAIYTAHNYCGRPLCSDECHKNTWATMVETL